MTFDFNSVMTILGFAMAQVAALLAGGKWLFVHFSRQIETKELSARKEFEKVAERAKDNCDKVEQMAVRAHERLDKDYIRRDEVRTQFKTLQDEVHNMRIEQNRRLDSQNERLDRILTQIAGDKSC